MPPILSESIELLSPDSFGTVKLVTIGYFALLWVSIIIWVTRDALSRSNSILFQAFAILLNIIVPLLGVLLYPRYEYGSINLLSDPSFPWIRLLIFVTSST